MHVPDELLDLTELGEHSSIKNRLQYLLRRLNMLQLGALSKRNIMYIKIYPKWFNGKPGLPCKNSKREFNIRKENFIFHKTSFSGKIRARY